MSSTPVLLLLLSGVALVLMSLLYVHSQMQSNERTIADINAVISDLARELDHQRDVAQRNERKARARTASAVAAAAAASSSKSEEAMNVRQLKLQRERDVAVELGRVREEQLNEALSAARRAENVARDVKRQMREHLDRLNEWSNSAALLAKARVHDDDDDHRRRPDDHLGDLDTPLRDIAPMVDPVVARTPPPTPTGKRFVGSVVTRAVAMAATTTTTPAPTRAPFVIAVAFSIEHDDGELAARHIKGLLPELKSTQSPLLVFVRNDRLDNKWSAQFRDEKAVTIVHQARDRVPASALLTDLATPDEQTTSRHLVDLLNHAAQLGSDFVLITTDRATLCDRAWPSIFKSITLAQNMARNGWGSIRFAAGLDGLLVHRIALQQLIAFLLRYGQMASTEVVVSQWIHGSWPGAMMYVDSAPRSPITFADFNKVNHTQPSTAQRHLLHFNELNAKFQSMMPVVPCMEPLARHINPREIVPDKTALSASCKLETIRPCW